MDILHRNSSLPFYETSRTFASHQCLNPRDKVYSMLALAIHPIYQDFKPNYREDVAIVYTDLFTRMVRETDGNFACFMVEDLVLQCRVSYLGFEISLK